MQNTQPSIQLHKIEPDEYEQILPALRFHPVCVVPSVFRAPSFAYG
jgi:hypothetical protein